MTAPTNAEPTPTQATGAVDAGTNPPVKTLLQTQAINGVNAQGQAVGFGIRAEDGTLSTLRRNSETGELYDPGGIPSGSATIDPGAGKNDDSGAPAAAVRPGTTLSTDQFITPKPNVLDSFVNYTYRASVYLMTPQQVNRLTLSKKKTINGYYLLFQSGGAPTNTGGFQGANSQQPVYYENDGKSSSTTTTPTSSSPDAGRNPAFPNDFYIDNITIETLMAGSMKTAHASANIKFTVVEPNGITLLDNLYQAVQDFMPVNVKRPINYNAITYLMVIRFYGYDQNGNLITNIGAPDASGTSDPNAIIEKFIPFRLSKVDMQISSKLVSYNFEGLPYSVSVAAGTRRGTIPYDIQLTASTVGQILTAKQTANSNTAPSATNPGGTTTVPQTETAINPETGEQYQRLKAPDTASSAPSASKTITQGLADAMNDFQKNLVKQGVYEKADVYEINLDPAIAKASVVLKSTKVEKSQSAMGNPDALLQEKIAADISAKNIPITAGMQLVQVIELIIRNSDYIRAEELAGFSANPDSDALETKNPSGKQVQWFNISFSAEQLEYDSLRNDFAYKIIYNVTPWQIDNFNSKFFPMNKFRGLHKSYPYWFTGKNIAVLDYSETLNNLYNITVSGAPDKENIGERQRRLLTSSMREIPFYNYSSASSETRQGTETKANEAAANLAENLYDPSGLALCKLKIVGDPAWMQQGSFVGGVTPQELTFTGFLPDGTINYDSGQVNFEVAWQRPEDYDINTGLADPYSRTSARNGNQRQPIQSRVYTARTVTSEFNNGKFTQNIEGLLYTFLKPREPNNKAATAPVPKTNQATDDKNNYQPAATNTPAQTSQRLGGEANPAGNNPAQTASSLRTPTTYYENDGTPSTGVSQSAVQTAMAAAGSQGAGGMPVAPTTAEFNSGAAAGNSPAEPQQASAVLPAQPPEPPTTGTGQTVGSSIFVPPATADRVNFNTLAGVPSAPQDTATET